MESDFDSAEVLGELVADWGHDVRVALTVTEVPNIIEEFCPDIAFIELGFPTIAGYELLRTLTSLPASRTCKFVAMSSSGSSDIVQKTLAVGFQHCLVKPIAIEALRRMLVDSEGARPDY